MSTSNGLLSQAVQNIRNMAQQLNSLRNLPPSAQTSRDVIVSSLMSDTDNITASQTDIQQFVATSMPTLQQAQSLLNQNVDLTRVSALIMEVNHAAATIQLLISKLNTGVINTKNQISNLLSTSLYLTVSQLSNQLTALSAQAQSAKQEADSIRSKEKYFALLGVLGLAGLAAAAAALAVEEKKVNDLLAQVSNYQAQMATVNTLVQSVNTLITDVSNMLNKLSDSKNAVDIIASDSSEVLANLADTQSGQAQAKLYLIGVITQLQTLATDAS